MLTSERVDNVFWRICKIKNFFEKHKKRNLIDVYGPKQSKKFGEHQLCSKNRTSCGKILLDRKIDKKNLKSFLTQECVGLRSARLLHKTHST